MLQGRVSHHSPFTQFLPPFIAAISMFLVRICSPCPQVTEQVLQFPNKLHVQLTKFIMKLNSWGFYNILWMTIQCSGCGKQWAYQYSCKDHLCSSRCQHYKPHFAQCNNNCSDSHCNMVLLSYSHNFRQHHNSNHRLYMSPQHWDMHLGFWSTYKLNFLGRSMEPPDSHHSYFGCRTRILLLCMFHQG